MKTILMYASSSLILLCAGLCCGDRVGYEEIRYNIETENSIFIDDDKKEYAPGEILWVNISVPKEQTTVEGTEIDIFELTGEENIDTGFKLYLVNEYSGGAEINFRDEDLISETGSALPYEHEQTEIAARLQLQETAYLLRFGIKLPQTGDFYLTSQYDQPFQFYLTGDYMGDTYNGVWLNATIRESENGHQFNFTVTE